MCIRDRARGHVKLFDFGGARQEIKTEADPKSSVVIKKDGYTPIEQIAGSANQGPWTDVYAMAATIYFCICGKAPASSNARVAEPGCFKTPSQMGVSIDKKVEDVLLKGLAIRVQDRYQSMREFQKALEDAKWGEVHSRKIWPFVLGGGLAAAVGIGVVAVNMLPYGRGTEKVTETESETEDITETESETEDITETESETENITETESETEDITETESETGIIDGWPDTIEIQEGIYKIASAMNTQMILSLSNVVLEANENAIGKLDADQGIAVFSELYKIDKQEDDSYRISPYNTQEALTFKFDGFRTVLVSEPYVGSKEQSWYFELTDKGQIKIRNGNGYYVDCQRGSSDIGTRIEGIENKNQPSQEWNLLYMDVEKLPQDNTYSDEVQDGTYVISNAMNLATRLKTGESYISEEKWIELGKITLTEQFIIESQPNGSYKIMSEDKGLALTFVLTCDGTMLMEQPYMGLKTQEWYFEKMDDGFYKIRNGNGNYMDCQYGNSEPGTKVVGIEGKEGLNQEWKLSFRREL